jgi:uncharacterized membrane protein YqjE
MPAMATVHRLSPRELHHDTIAMRLGHLLKLELELGVAETRELVISLLIAVAVAFVSAVALVASLVVLLTAAFAPLFDLAWQPFVIAGGSVLVISTAAIGWSVWRVKHLEWPHETITSLQENWRWFAAQLKSKLTLK